MADGKVYVLVIDSEPGNLRALGALLQPLGQHVLCARSGEEAVRLVLAHAPVVILLDVSIPATDGFATARTLRQCERSRRTPIICLTGASKWPVPKPAEYEIGPVDYVLKPVVAEVLRFKVSVFLELHREETARADETRARKLAEERLQGAEAQLRSLATRLNSIRDEERIRIAREIHDELGQVLTSLKMDVACLEKQFCDERHPARARTERMRRLIDSTVHLVQRISTGMRPEILDELGLVAALRWQAREFEKHTGIRCRPRLPARHLVLDAELSTAVFRAFQEILTNVARHARANSVKACLDASSGRLLLEVADDGIGILEDRIRHRDSLGLLGMRERAQSLGGQLTISCKPGGGTMVTVNIPLRAALRGIELSSPPPRKNKMVDFPAPMFANEQSLAHGSR
jgi:signal transduction histidine kinase